MNRREAVLALAALGATSTPFAARSQGKGKIWRVGIIFAGHARVNNTLEGAFLAGMKQYGYEVSRNLVVDVRYADADPARYPALAEELIALKPDVLLGSSAGVSLAFKRRTSVIPIVICTVSDAVGLGLAKSLARSGGNVTGLSMQLHELSGKHMEILGELLPSLRRVALLTDLTQPKVLSEPYERLAKVSTDAKGMELSVHRVDGVEQIRDALRSMATRRVEAVLLNPSPRFNALRGEIIRGASTGRLPSIGWEEAYAQDGGLMSYGPSFLEAYRRVAYFVDRIFKGETPSDLPIEQPTKFNLVVNTKAAKALGIGIPGAVLVRADRVIE